MSLFSPLCIPFLIILWAPLHLYTTSDVVVAEVMVETAEETEVIVVLVAEVTAKAAMKWESNS